MTHQKPDSVTGETVTIFVRLLDEGVDVWRPVTAQLQRDNVYRILDQPYDRNLERWQFEPGDVVRCEPLDLDGGPVLAAAKRVATP